MTKAFIYDAIRTPRGVAKESGALNEFNPLELLKQLYFALQSRTQLNPELIEDVMLGCVTQIGEQGGNIARASILYAGLPESIPGLTINRFCSSSLDATGIAAEKIKSGAYSVLVAGGVESMSRVAAFSDKPAWMLEPKLSMKTRAVPIGIGADLIATLAGYQREQLDAIAQQSQQRSANAQQNGHFNSSLIPLNKKNGDVVSVDEGIRGDISMEKLANLQGLFVELGAKGVDQGILPFYPELSEIKHDHTVASAPSMVDAASLLLVADESLLESGASKPRAEILGYKSLCGPAVEVLTGGTLAAKALLTDLNIEAKDIELVEYNESYAGPTLKFMEDMGFDNTIVNVNGGAMSLGHPMGATGGILIGMLLDELERQNKKLGLVVVCGATGSGSAMLIKRC
jgi:acetyl-CoA C-acetyltransferase